LFDPTPRRCSYRPSGHRHPATGAAPPRPSERQPAHHGFPQRRRRRAPSSPPRRLQAPGDRQSPRSVGAVINLWSTTGRNPHRVHRTAHRMVGPPATAGAIERRLGLLVPLMIDRRVMPVDKQNARTDWRVPGHAATAAHNDASHGRFVVSAGVPNRRSARRRLPARSRDASSGCGQSRGHRDGRDGPAHWVPSRADASGRTRYDPGESANSCHLVEARKRHGSTGL
jgi:hypothetical protein